MRIAHFAPLFALTLSLLTPAPASSQAAPDSAKEQFQKADWFQRTIGHGVVWHYYHFDNLFNSRQSISYIEIDLSAPGVSLELPYAQSRTRTSELIKTQVPRAVAGINGTYFAVSRPYGHRTYMKVNNRVIPPIADWAEWGTESALVFHREKKQYTVTKRPEQGWDAFGDYVTDVMANGPHLLEKGEVVVDVKGGHCESRHPRTMVGIKPGNRLILATADGRNRQAAGLTCEETALVMQALGCTAATNLDGGGSTAMYVKDEPFNGIVNYPCDNRKFDHAGERTTINAIAVIASPVLPAPMDARLESIESPTTITAGQQGAITAVYKNIGTQPWHPGQVSLTTSRPVNRTSESYVAGQWASPSTPWRLPAGQTVAPGQTITISIPLQAPAAQAGKSVTEVFQLSLADGTRFGPADNALRVTYNVGRP